MDDPMAMKRPAGEDENAGMKRKAYEKELRKLQVELCHLQAWVKAKGAVGEVLIHRALAATQSAMVAKAFCNGTFVALSPRHMMIGQQQTVRTDERSRAAVIQADARKPNVIEPRLSGRETVARLKLFYGRIVEGPEAFIGDRDGGLEENEKAQQWKTAARHFHGDPRRSSGNSTPTI